MDKRTELTARIAELRDDVQRYGDAYLAEYNNYYQKHITDNQTINEMNAAMRLGIQAREELAAAERELAAMDARKPEGEAQ